MGARFSVSVERGVAVPMRDGTVLYADIYRPSGPGRYPVILTRTAYDRTAVPPRSGSGRPARGMCWSARISAGGMNPRARSTPSRTRRTTATTPAPGSASSRGRTGGSAPSAASYVGLTQWQAALAGAPGLQAMVPNVTAADYHEGWCYQGGAFELSFIKSWTLTWLATDTARRLAASDPAFQAKLETLWDRCDNMEADFDIMPLAGDPLLAELAPYYDEWLAHPDHGPFWDQFKVDGNYGRLDQAVLHAGGWYDVFLGGTIQNYMGMRAGAKTEAARKAQRLLIGPWDHMTITNQTPSASTTRACAPGTGRSTSTASISASTIATCATWTTGSRRSRRSESSRWARTAGASKTSGRWPGPSSPTFYFHSDGSANTLNGDGALSREEPSAGSRPDHYIYDPLNPVPNMGGGLCCNEAKTNGGQYDQRSVEARPDVLCYTSAPLEQPTSR